MNLKEDNEKLRGLLAEARTTFEMWKDVAPAIRLCADIDKALAKQATAPVQDEQYPPCDFCGVIPDHHPWHGSGMFKGEDSPHIHACNDCRHLLPTRPAQKVNSVDTPEQTPVMFTNDKELAERVAALESIIRAQRKSLDTCAAQIAALQAEQQLVPGLAEAPSRVEAVIVAIRDLWYEDECPAYPVVAKALRRMLRSAPIVQTAPETNKI